MLLLDTHMVVRATRWVWLADESDRLSERHREVIARHRNDGGLGISAVSCWEVAKLVEYGRLELKIEIETWMRAALRLSELQLVELTPRIAIASTQLPGAFHSDPADQMIAATARVHALPLATEDRKIRGYDHVTTV